jgi:hypothetical protein
MNARARTGMASIMLVVGWASALGLAGCRKGNLADQDQIGAAVGEVMASVDESTKGSGATARLPILRMPDEMRAPMWRQVYDGFSHVAYAAGCVQSPFATCTSGVRTRSFNQCSIGSATLDGMVTLTFSDTHACAVGSAGDTVDREADFTLTGPYGGTLDVSSPGGGQLLTKTTTGFDYSVPGMRRVLTGPGGRKLFDISTRTVSPIHINGSSRADLVIVSGSLEVSHNLAGYKVTLQPENLTWNPSCNCAVSGKLTGTVASSGKLDGKIATVTITGCGQAEVDIDGETDSVTLDRCATAN